MALLLNVRHTDDITGHMIELFYLSSDAGVRHHLVCSVHLSVQVRPRASCSPCCAVLLQDSLRLFSVTPAGGSVGAWIRTGWSSTGRDRAGHVHAVCAHSADTDTIPYSVLQTERDL